VYDAGADRAYWLYVQAYFRQRGSRVRKGISSTITLSIPRKNVLGVEAVKRFCDFKAAVQAQLREVTHGEGD